MDRTAARSAAHAWHLESKAVRRVVVARGREGLAVDDPKLARITVDWGRSEIPLTRGPRMFWVALALIGFGLASLRLIDPLLQWLLALLLWAAPLAIGRWHQGAEPAAAANLRNLVQRSRSPVDRSPYHYEARDTLEVRAVGRPTWLLPGLVALVVLTDISLWWAHGLVDGLRSLAMFALGGLLFVPTRRRGRDDLKYQPRRGIPVLTLTSAGLYVAHLDRTFSWSQVTAAEVPPAGRPRQSQLAIRFRLADPDLALTFPAHWLDQDPGVILVTAQQYMAIASATNPPATKPPGP